MKIKVEFFRTDESLMGEEGSIGYLLLNKLNSMPSDGYCKELIKSVSDNRSRKEWNKIAFEIAFQEMLEGYLTIYESTALELRVGDIISDKVFSIHSTTSNSQQCIFLLHSMDWCFSLAYRKWVEEDILVLYFDVAEKGKDYYLYLKTKK